MNGVRVTNRLDSVRHAVQEMIQSMSCEIRKQDACIQLNGVSATAAMLAMKRYLNQELAAIAGLLHNYYFYKTGIDHFPGPNSAEAVRPLLRDMRIFAKDEQLTLLRAIFYQGDRGETQGPYEELIKDACILQAHLHAPERRVPREDDAIRLNHVLQELAIPSIADWQQEDPRLDGAKDEDPVADKRGRLADIAETLAGTTILGVLGDQCYREICRYWPDAAIYNVLQNSWCAAFVYHCFLQAGFRMPIRYPNGIYRFAGVGAWIEWARLPETDFLRHDGQDGFAPQRGDIVIYDKLLSEDAHDHIGIVLACKEDELVVAEGNRDNQNYSCVFNRDRRHCILGYIRIANDYRFDFGGDYNPIL